MKLWSIPGCLPASPVHPRRIRYNMTKASRDTVVSPDSLVISPKVYEREFKATYSTFSTVSNPAAVTRSIGLPADAPFIGTDSDKKLKIIDIYLIEYENEVGNDSMLFLMNNWEINTFFKQRTYDDLRISRY